MDISVSFYGLKTWREHPEWFEEGPEPSPVPWDLYHVCEENDSDWMLFLTISHYNGADAFLWDLVWCSDTADLEPWETVVGEHWSCAGSTFTMSGL